MDWKGIWIIVALVFCSTQLAGGVQAKDWSKGKYKMSCSKNAKVKLKWFRKNGWSLFHTVEKKDATLRVFRKGLTFKMAKQYKKSGKLCVYSE